MKVLKDKQLSDFMKVYESYLCFFSPVLLVQIDFVANDHVKVYWESGVKSVYKHNPHTTFSIKGEDLRGLLTWLQGI